MANRATDWLRQANQDLEHAEESRERGRHEWSCFAAHQAAEKAIKALHLRHGQEAWGHVVAKLIDELPEGLELPDSMREYAQVLDNFYIPTRSPASHPEGSPFDHFGPLQSSTALKHARSILEFVNSEMA